MMPKSLAAELIGENVDLEYLKRTSKKITKITCLQEPML